MEQESIRVTIYDQVYHLKSPAADRAHMEEVASYVDNRMAAIASRTQTVDSIRVAVLAALHIADELLRLRQEHELLENGVEAKSREYAALLEEALEPSSTPVLATGTGD